MTETNITRALPISKADLNINWVGYPDYNSEKALPHYQMPSVEVTENGWLYAMYETPASGSSSQWFEFRINNIPILSVGTSHANRHSVFIPVSAGDILTACNDAGGTIVDITEIRFIPLKTQ